MYLSFSEKQILLCFIMTGWIKGKGGVERPAVILLALKIFEDLPNSLLSLSSAHPINASSTFSSRLPGASCIELARGN